MTKKSSFRPEIRLSAKLRKVQHASKAPGSNRKRCMCGALYFGSHSAHVAGAQHAKAMGIRKERDKLVTKRKKAREAKERAIQRKADRLAKRAELLRQQRVVELLQELTTMLIPPKEQPKKPLPLLGPRRVLIPQKEER